MQEPTRVRLGTERVWVGSGSRRRYKEISHEMVYVPILSTLGNLLQKEDVLRQVCTVGMQALAHES